MVSVMHHGQPNVVNQKWHLGVPNLIDHKIHAVQIFDVDF